MSKQTKEIAIQLKRHKQTFIITTKSLKVADIKQQLHSVITEIGGLSNGEESEVNDQDSIDIPIPSFETNSDDDEDLQEENLIGDLKATKNKKVPKLGDMVIGTAKDESDPYAGFKDVQDESTKLEIKDFGILGFRLYDENYNVVKPVQVDDE